MNYISIVLKGNEFKIKYTQKRDKQELYQKKCAEIERKNAELMILKSEKKQLMVDMLDERQMIIYKNSYNKTLSSEELKTNKQYLKQKELLKHYDGEHGQYIELL